MSIENLSTQKGMNMADQLKFKEIYSQSINQPDIFWGKAAEDVHLEQEMG
jgi:hypothetical protein